MHFDNCDYLKAEPDEEHENLPVPSDLFFEVFPFNIVFNRGMKIINTGSGLQNIMPELDGLEISDAFGIIRPLTDFSWDGVC